MVKEDWFDVQVVVYFLSALGLSSSRWPVVVSANRPGMKGWPTTSETFVECLADWIKERNPQGFNIYFHPATPFKPRRSRAKKSDFVWSDYLHLDIDWKDDQGRRILATEEKAAMAARLLSDARPPTMLWDSGNGLQALWRCPASNIEEVERGNRGLISQYGGDPGTHNADRLLRVPGTINWPDEKKQKDGLVPCPTRLIAITDRDYELADFDLAPPLPKFEGRNWEREITAVEDFSDLDDYWLPKVFFNIVEDGRDENDPNPPKDRSRSGWLMKAVCIAIRCGVPDAMIAGILLNEEWGISESVYDHGSRTPEEYATRQVWRAHQFLSLATQLDFEVLPEEAPDFSAVPREETPFDES